MTVHISTLDNGLRVVTDTMREAESVVAGAWVGVGTRHEPQNANGVAHLVEHMLFKGTKKRSSYALSAEIENNGGSMNAHTTREQTAYYARVLPEETALAMEIVADMLKNSVFDPKELVREKQVIVQEIGRDLDSPEDHAFDLMYDLMFSRQKLGKPILGSAQTVTNLSRATAKSYVRSHYHAGNMVIVAAGRVEHEAFVALARKYFGKLPRGKMPKTEKARPHSGIKLMPKKIEQLHLILGFAGPSFHGRDYYAAQVLSVVLGGSASSRLFQKVREKRGLVYTINSSHMAFSDTGIFHVYAGTDPARVKELIPVTCHELMDVTHNVTPAELARAKAQTRADILMGEENVMRRADNLGHNMIVYGKPLPTEEVLRKFMAVTKDEVEATASRLFARRPIVTALGPLKGMESYRKIADRLKLKKR